MIDDLIINFDKALRTLCGNVVSRRGVPGGDLPEADLSADEKERVAALMRVNHVGEVCAQALYQGQALVCDDERVRAALDRAAAEEMDHLAWTARRIEETGGRKSWLNPLWYAGAFSIGVLAGKAGDGWNLGFLAETERQVEAHLDGHLGRLPEDDARSRAIVARMKDDEAAHATTAERLGAKALPAPVKAAMRVAARIMTTVAYRL